MGGFLPRWLFFTARTKDYVLPVRDNPQEGQEHFVNHWIGVLKGHRRPDLKLSHDAFHHYWRWRRDLETGADSAILPWVNRMGDYAYKVAMIYEASMEETLKDISSEAMACATR